MISLPEDVTEWLRGVFSTCNREASSKLSLVPNAHEPWIDFAIIENLQRVSTPFCFKSDWLVNIDTHWLGSAPLWPDEIPRWEIADVGFLVMFRTAGQLIRSKVALLQCKRLYANKQRPETPHEIRTYYHHGFGRMFNTDEKFAEMTHPKLYRFDADSEYSTLTKDSRQWTAIAEYEKEKQVPVYYMLYNPLEVPCSVSTPHQDSTPELGPCRAGCRVIPSKYIRDLMASAKEDDSPTYGQIEQGLPSPFNAAPHRSGWMLEHFVVDLLLQCKTGRVMDIRNDDGLYNVFY